MRRFITVFTRARHGPVSWPTWILSIPIRLISLRSILIISCRQCLGLTSSLSFQVLQRNFCTPFSFPPWSDHFFICAYKLWSSTLCKFLQSSVTSSRLGPNILVTTLLSNTLNLYSWETKFHTHTKQTCNITNLNSLRDISQKQVELLCFNTCFICLWLVYSCHSDDAVNLNYVLNNIIIFSIRLT
jgi:hypothetical protein